MSAVCVSVVVPVYNEEAVIASSLERLVAVLKGIQESWEIVVVDDGSADSSAALVEAAARANPAIKLVQFSRNFGHQNAVTAGLMACRGDYVCVMDADLQDPPELLPSFLAKARAEGWDVVYGVRSHRAGSIWKRLCYAVYYRVQEALSDYEVPLDAGDFSLMSRRVVDAINRLPERRRYVRGLRAWVGFRQVGIPYTRPERAGGLSKYGMRRLTRLGVKGVLSTSRAPLRFSAYMGVLMSLSGFGWMLHVVHVKIVHGGVPTGYASLMTVILLVGGVQLLLLAVNGAYIGRILDQVEGRPHFVVGRTVNCDPPAAPRSGA